MNTDIQNERTFASGDGTESIVDKFAVVVKKDETTTVGHFQREKQRYFQILFLTFFSSKATIVELKFRIQKL